jgi:DNA polymerase-3 subunit gamma/tau
VSALDQVVSAGEAEVNDELVRRVLGIADREAFFTLAGAVLERDPKAALRALHQAFEKGLDARDLAEGLSEHIRHILVLKVDPEAGDLVALAREDLERLKQQGGSWSENDLLRLLKLASEASWPMRDSPQPLIHLEAALLQMATLEPGETLAEILAKLEALEQRLGGAPAPAAGSGGRPAAASRSAAPLPGGGAQRSDVAPAPPRSAPPAAAAPWTPPRAHAPAPPLALAPPKPAAPLWPSVTAGADAPVATLDTEVECDEAAERCWRETLAGLNARKRMLGAFLEESHFVGLAGDTLVVAMDHVHCMVVKEKENLALVTEVAQRAFGRALELRCVPLEASQQRRRPALEDVAPMVERAIEFFQGELIEPPKSRRGERTEE